MDGKSSSTDQKPSSTPGVVLRMEATILNAPTLNYGKSVVTPKTEFRLSMDVMEEGGNQVKTYADCCKREHGWTNDLKMQPAEAARPFDNLQEYNQ